MMYRQGKIISLRQQWGQACEYDVRLDDGRTVRALGYVPIVGRLDVDETVILSASAFERGLGTGGYMMIVVAPDNLPADPPPQPGHIVKARYTPQQFMVQGVDEQESQYHDILANADSIAGMPVVVADLHSALPAIVAGIRQANPELKIAYVMTDGGALPAWFSMASTRLTELGHILGTITCGQAFGGQLEAVNVHSALLAAHHIWNADIAIVAQGPGNLGTGSKWGFSGLACGETLNAVATLGGQPIACLRLSNADSRERHYGISHHSLRVLSDVVKVVCDVVVPEFTSDLNGLVSESWQARLVFGVEELEKLTYPIIHRVRIDGLYGALEKSPVPLKTMGRGLDQDVTAFIAAAAAGRFAAQQLV
ncbi:DUF3866 family protein [Arcanobacterium pinnipediorum]|uniref:DUF3866 family protein n=2 Tax=Arcanobacterium pinnipediorum TaxID=1503041 RepID=A0ABY5ALV1_9ACTO|nr:DUF3866 family protein [Arcanobacterium pinnipediorum]USR80234.1 DUF3866 family protein [Arcanobacterium pinnipediorum]